jgi:hypothetical protein
VNERSRLSTVTPPVNGRGYDERPEAAREHQKFKNTDSDVTLAPLVLGMLRSSYSRRAPTILICA